MYCSIFTQNLYLNRSTVKTIFSLFLFICSQLPTTQTPDNLNPFNFPWRFELLGVDCSRIDVCVNVHCTSGVWEDYLQFSHNSRTLIPRLPKENTWNRKVVIMHFSKYFYCHAAFKFHFWEFSAKSGQNPTFRKVIPNFKLTCSLLFTKLKLFLKFSRLTATHHVVRIWWYIKRISRFL